MNKKLYSNIYILMLIIIIVIVIVIIIIKYYSIIKLENFNNNQQIHFITYGDDNVNCKDRIISEAEKFGRFDTIKAYSRKDISKEFMNKYENILNNNRGGGYWIWKFDIILSRLNEINDNDILVYTDCGCTININGINRFNEYVDMLNMSEYGIISFEMSYIEREWTIKQIFNYLNIDIDSNNATSEQYTGAILIMKKTEHTIMIFNKCIELLNNDQNLITDIYNSDQNTYFKENRHDQSILSLIRKKYNSIVIKNDYDDLWRDINEDNKHIPFIATRKK